jgi:hypothetical protein
LATKLSGISFSWLYETLLIVELLSIKNRNVKPDAKGRTANSSVVNLKEQKRERNWFKFIYHFARDDKYVVSHVGANGPNESAQ